MERRRSRAARGRMDGLSTSIGTELRRLRRERGMTQASVAAPLSKGLLSAVEHGRTLPSIPALVLFLDRLGTPLGTFFASVNREMTAVYYPAHERHTNATPTRRHR